MSSKKYVDVSKTLDRIEADLDLANYNAIRKFVDHSAAEGISEVRQERTAQVLKSIIVNCCPDGFQLEGATEDELKQVLANLNRSDYADSTKHTMRSVLKKFYKIENGGHEHPEKVDFFTVGTTHSTVTRDELFTDDELKQLFRSFTSLRDRAFTMVLYETAARPGELLAANIGDFTTNEKGDFIYLEGSKGTPDRTNQLVRAGRTLREWLSQHPLGGEIGDIDDPSAPMWVKTEQQTCRHCGNLPRDHKDTCSYEPDLRDRTSYQAFHRRFKDACRRADIPQNKSRPYNMRHTRLTQVATFMGYEQLNKFAGWKPGSDRAKVYVHLNNDDVNRAIREEYGLTNTDDEDKEKLCPFCSTPNQSRHTECRQCGRPLSLKKQAKQEEKLSILERLQELEEKGVLQRLEDLDSDY